MFKEQFSKHLSQFNTSPFLFIGSGFSRRYLNLEDWEGLLKHMVERLEIDMPYEYFSSNANGGLPRVASLIGKHFNESWWRNEKFASSRGAYATSAKSMHSPFKYEIAKYVIERSIDVNEKYSEEINLLKKAVIDGIITTNWDTLTEKIFPDYTTFSGQNELIFSELFSVGEIYKIHGSVSDPETMILTTEDYEDFNDRYSYLAAKLLTVFVEHPIIFIGYSIEDRNIQEILRSVLKCLTPSKIELIKDRLIFCSWNPEVTETTLTDTTLHISDTTLPIKKISISNFADLYSVLATTKKRLPTKILRKMKGMIYDFVKTTDPRSKVYVTGDLEKLEDFHNVQFMYGVGLTENFGETGVVGLKASDLIEDVVTEGSRWNSGLIATKLLPTLHGRYIPYFKYLSKAGFIDEKDGFLRVDQENPIFEQDFIEKVNAIRLTDFGPAASYERRRAEISQSYKSIEALTKDEGLTTYHKLIYVPLLDVENVDLEELRKFLTDSLDVARISSLATHFRKVACLYDFLRYKMPFINKEHPFPN